MNVLMSIRSGYHGMLRRIVALPAKLHRDEDGQMVLIAGVLILLLAMALAIPVQLSITVRQKIQAQNAVDAAAITGAIWQLRGLNVVQGLNDLTYLLDSIALFGLIVGAICGPLVGVPIANLAAIVGGNVALATAVGTHFAAQCVVSPIRDVAAHGWSIVCYVGASESAKANQASPMIGATRNYFDRLSGFTKFSYLGDSPESLNEAVETHDPTEGQRFFSSLLNALDNLDIYAMGFEMNLNAAGGDAADVTDAIGNMLGGAVDGVKPMWLHVKREKGKVLGLPLRVEDEKVTAMLSLATPLVPMHGIANVYFNNCGVVQGLLDRIFGKINNLFLEPGDAATSNDGAKWNHAWYISNPELVKMKKANKKEMAILPAATWITIVRSASGGLNMPSWNRIGGLGVPSQSNLQDHGELGAMALASARLTADPVRKVRFAGLNGNVLLVPVKITDGEDDALLFGICH